MDKQDAICLAAICGVAVPTVDAAMGSNRPLATPPTSPASNAREPCQGARERTRGAAHWRREASSQRHSGVESDPRLTPATRCRQRRPEGCRLGVCLPACPYTPPTARERWVGSRRLGVGSDPAPVAPSAAGVA
jgi:hypothetical protein